MSVSVGIKRRAGEAHAFGEGRKAIVCAEAGPVVVGAIEDILVSV